MSQEGRQISIVEGAPFCRETGQTCFTSFNVNYSDEREGAKDVVAMEMGNIRKCEKCILSIMCLWLLGGHGGSVLKVLPNMAATQVATNMPNLDALY